ncbi:MAG: DUF2934 domain-containing protein [Acetobacteraceae bacterium]
MSTSDRDEQQAVRELAYLLWEREGGPDGRELAHWGRALAIRSAHERNPYDAFAKDAEAVIDGDPRADFPALLAKDVSGGQRRLGSWVRIGSRPATLRRLGRDVVED